MAPTVWSSALFGRDAELEALRACFRRSAPGRLQILIIEGEAGIGKTTLLSEALDEARSIGFGVFEGRCEELERGRAYGPLVDALGCTRDADDPRRREIASMLAENPSSGPASTRFRIVDAFGDFVEELAVGGPVALAVEDLHWADSATISTLRSLSKRLTYLPVVIAGTYRPMPRTPELASFLEVSLAEGGLRIPLGPLNDEAVTQLVAEALGTEPGQNLLESVASAAGNPLFVRELVDAIGREGAIEVAGGRAEVSRLVLPPDLRLTILRRISFLSEEALALLRLAAVLGTTFSPAHVAALAGRPVTDLLGPFDEALRAGVVREEEPSLRFRHELIREALYQELPAGLRRALHLEAARALDALGALPDQVAQHYTLGATEGDEQAIHALIRAAEHAPPTTRLDLLERASDLMPPSHEERESTEVELAHALIWAGHVRDGEKLASDLLDRLPEGELARRVRLSLTRALWAQARWTELLERTNTWLAGGVSTDEERAMLLAHRSIAGAFVRRTIEGDSPEAFEREAEEAEEALQIGERAKNVRLTVFALMALAPIRGFQDRIQEELELAQRAVAIVERDRDPDLLLIHPHLILGLALHDHGRVDEAERVLQEGRRLGERLGSRWDVPLYHGVLATIYYKFGRWSESIAEAEACLATSEEVGTRVGLMVSLLALGWIALFRNDLDEAERYLEEMEGIAEDHGPQWGESESLRIALTDAGGDPESVRASLRELPRLATISLLPVFPLGLALDRRLATTWVADLEERHGSPEDPESRGCILFARGLVDDDPDVLLDATATLREVNLWVTALAAEAAGECLMRHNRKDEAGTLFREALDTFDQLEASRLTAQTLATMRSLGLRPGKRGRRGRQRVGWEALTETERKVAWLAAEGLTNPQIAERLFVSRHTVHSHLKHIFEKLVISSRVELATEAARRGADAEARS
ncbi:MAG: AAA family ATPase [Actinobacteria bacterium]|nr:AAA family ATPase [Actinomycetota bacterium]